MTARRSLARLALAAALAGAPPAHAEPAPAAAEVPPLPWVELAADGNGFALAGSGEAFVPLGFNYDHDDGGRLLEDYWEHEWQRVVEDFAEMEALGANVVRIHLQFARFMRSPEDPDGGALARLGRLVELAERQRLYLIVTGLGCYHKADVPGWYDALGERERWDAQARFWVAVARTCRESPAVFCYDLMNEPVVPGGAPRDDWLGPAFAGKHFVQFITRDAAGRARAEIAASWVDHLVRAIRAHDRRHLVTLGFVPWSLDRPGLTSGFVPGRVSADLDFLAVHLYPESGKLDAALETLRGFAAVGKPVLVEETFPLKCNARELGEFVERAGALAAGWVGFYWGVTPDEYRRRTTVEAALTLGWLELFQRLAAEQRPRASTLRDGR